MLQIGDLAPDFELLSDESRPVKLSDLRGRRVVLFFFPRADTPGCTIQACGFRDAYPIIEEKNAIVLGVSPAERLLIGAPSSRAAALLSGRYRAVVSTTLTGLLGQEYPLELLPPRAWRVATD